MGETSGRKLFVGPRFRRIRRQLGLSQTQLAEGLGISPSYVNLIERNQRPVSAQILLRLAENYDLDLRDLAGGDDDRAFVELNEIFSDPLFRPLEIPKQEIRDFAELAPGVGHALQRLYAAYVEARRGETIAASRMAGRDETRSYEANPVERVRDLIEANRNHFPTLEIAAEKLRDELDAPAHEVFRALSERLRERHGIIVRVLPVEVMRDSLRRFDRHRRHLLLSELIDGSGRVFQAAFQLALLEAGAQIDEIIARSDAGSDAARRLFRISLANYFAAAAIMPYARFHEAAETLAYDIGLLGQRFGASFEQICHRLTTLQRPSARGVPFFMLRVDHAGNVSKRFSSGSFPFSKFGGTCPLWNVHATFDTPGKVVTQVIELPDGMRYFSIAQTVRRPTAPYAQPQPRYAIGLGCELKYAPRLVYSMGLNLSAAEAIPIGINCRLCERAHCSQRAEPPLTRELLFDETTRGVSPFSFSAAREF
ncbi:MAG TPA: short-chain fatty acyl-CoA regulator family protein, partial [Xanthobacteraceae bacterium]|nr:short-chain fatty acyl-CoA regulator family protein [Xanthobacteraceae bacterium]